ncbi:unnamed protein product [Trifolium pratense]|uniref:Uncharacterized protein n=1 Tax=Trifolium pratense TaxID=57577 RepID=A0ACB0LPW3_TRIPR|nr:unnamed protein product [Trifolium pratense]
MDILYTNDSVFYAMTQRMINPLQVYWQKTKLSIPWKEIPFNTHSLTHRNPFISARLQVFIAEIINR